eukprot:SAG31_NODE_36850_length_309_cov_1.714286_1_plen_50_part_10
MHAPARPQHQQQQQQQQRPRAHALGDVFAASDYEPKPIVPLTDAQVQAFI